MYDVYHYINTSEHLLPLYQGVTMQLPAPMASSQVSIWWYRVATQSLAKSCYLKDRLKYVPDARLLFSVNQSGHFFPIRIKWINIFSPCFVYDASETSEMESQLLVATFFRYDITKLWPVTTLPWWVFICSMMTVDLYI